MFKRASLPIALFSALLACICALVGGEEQSTRTATRAPDALTSPQRLGAPIGPARR